MFNDFTVGPGLARPLTEIARSMPAADLAELLIGGILRSDLDLPDAHGMLGARCSRPTSCFPPLPNHLFQRDNSAFAYDGLSVHPMAKVARRRELLHSRTVWNYHPVSAAADLHFYYGNDDANHEQSTVEGGDILVLGNGAVMVGLFRAVHAPGGVQPHPRLLLRSPEPDRHRLRRGTAQGTGIHAPSTPR